MGLAIKKEESVECGKGARDGGMPRATLYCRGSDVTVTARSRQGWVGDEILVSVISKCHKMDKIAIDTFNSVQIMLKLFHTLWVKLEQG